MTARVRRLTGAMPAWVTLVLVLVGFGVSQGLTIGYVVKKTREFCGVIVLLDDRNQTVTPTTDDQRAFIDELHRYRKRLGCKDGDRHG